MLLGAAIQDGYIKNVKEPITNYLSELKGSEYDQVTIKQVLQMSSGVEWNEDYNDPYSDVNLAAGLNSSDLYKYLNKLDRVKKPGKKFNYNTAESNLIGGLIREAVGLLTLLPIRGYFYFFLQESELTFQFHLLCGLDTMRIKFKL